MRPNFSFLSAASNANLKSGGLLKWKKRLVKDVILLLSLVEVMKIVKLTFPLPDTPRLSSPRPRLRHDRRLALLSHPNLTLNSCILCFVLSLAHLPPLLTFPTVPVQGRRLRSSPTTGDPTFLSPSQRPCSYPTALRRATCPEESHSSFCSPFSPGEFLSGATNLSPSTATGVDKV